MFWSLFTSNMLTLSIILETFFIFALSILQVSGSHLHKHKKWLWKMWQVWPEKFKNLCFLDKLNIKFFFREVWYIYLRMHFLKVVLQKQFFWQYLENFRETSVTELIFDKFIGYRPATLLELHYMTDLFPVTLQKFSQHIPFRELLEGCFYPTNF